MISTLGGKASTNQVVRQVPLQLGSIIIPTDLLTLGVQNIDVILGTSWMTQYRVLLDIPSRVVEINSPTRGSTLLYLPWQECIITCASVISESARYATRLSSRVRHRSATWCSPNLKKAL
jgi:hypothetical protein